MKKQGDEYLDMKGGNEHLGLIYVVRYSEGGNVLGAGLISAGGFAALEDVDPPFIPPSDDYLAERLGWASGETITIETVPDSGEDPR